MTPARTDVLPLGHGLAVLMPMTRALTPRLLNDLGAAVVVVDEGRLDLGQRIVAELEDRFGVTDFDRIAHGDIDAKARRLGGLARSLAERRRKQEASEEVAPLAPVLGPTPGELKRLARADKKIAQAREAGDNKALNKAVDAKTLVFHDMERRDAAAYLAGRAAELAELELRREGLVIIEERIVDTPVLKDGAPVWRRGQIVTRRETVERPRITNRDGLETLATNHLDQNGDVRKNKDGTPMAPTIDGLQLAAGERYRDLYEDTDPEKGLTPPNPDRGGSRPGDPFGAKAVAAAQSRARMRAQIERLEARVQEEAGQRGVRILREVAGKGQTINAVGGGGSARTRNTKALQKALDCLAEAFGLA